jgi:hypothetical protein
MAITPFQSGILTLLAARRLELGESYVAGGVALNQLLHAPRKSRDIDLFHDTEEALASTWAGDRALLTSHQYTLVVLREAPSFVEARVSRENEHTLMQWARDSAFRFFPLISDPIMGLTLHSFDLATNKVLAMAGRLEPRDWIDILNCDRIIQPFGFLVWAACGKDPGFNPKSLLAAASRLHYSQAEIDSLDFEGPQPSAHSAGERWHEILAAARRTIELLPSEEAGKCVIKRDSGLFTGGVDDLENALKNLTLAFHEGRIGGSWPTFKDKGS